MKTPQSLPLKEKQQNGSNKLLDVWFTFSLSLSLSLPLSLSLTLSFTPQKHKTSTSHHRIKNWACGWEPVLPQAGSKRDPDTAHLRMGSSLTISMTACGFVRRNNFKQIYIAHVNNLIIFITLNRRGFDFLGAPFMPEIIYMVFKNKSLEDTRECSSAETKRFRRVQADSNAVCGLIASPFSSLTVNSHLRGDLDLDLYYRELWGY